MAAKSNTVITLQIRNKQYTECINANYTDYPYFCGKIILYFSHADEASEAN